MISQRFFFNAQRANGGQRVNRALNILENPQMKILEVACGEAAEKRKQCVAKQITQNVWERFTEKLQRETRNV